MTAASNSHEIGARVANDFKLAPLLNILPRLFAVS
jgi:hypothetical protein